MENNNYPQAKLDLSEILEYANSDVNNLDKQRILKHQLPLLQSYAKERDLISVIDLLESFPVNIQDEFWREFDENLGPELWDIKKSQRNHLRKKYLCGGGLVFNHHQFIGWKHLDRKEIWNILGS